MIKYTPASHISLALFKTPFEQKLDPKNRWVKMASVVPWDDMAKVFFDVMSDVRGRGSIDLRVVLGTLLVKHIEGISDEDTIRYVQENIYAQYFVGLPSFQTEAVFDSSLFVYIRKRLGKRGAAKLNEVLLKEARRLKVISHRVKPKKTKESDSDNTGDSGSLSGGDSETASQTTPETNKGTLKLDATVAPQHIGYPTDTRLVHEARQNSEALIDKLYNGNKDGWEKKPRTYRRKAQEQYLAFAKKRRPTKREVRKTLGKQLRFLRRNLDTINKMLDEFSGADERSHPWKHKDWKRFWVLVELYRQQDTMYQDGRKRIEDRIVNIAQPYVRPIKRGKAGKETEFGAKLNMSETEGFVRMDMLDFNNYNEGICLQQQIEAYKGLYGYFPELVLVDRIYLNRQNRKYLKDNGIRHSGPPLGKKPQMSRAEKLQRKKEQNKRSEIEGKFGQAKSKYGLDDIRTKLQETSYAQIGLILLGLNVLKLGKAFLWSFFTLFTIPYRPLQHYQLQPGRY